MSLGLVLCWVGDLDGFVLDMTHGVGVLDGSWIHINNIGRTIYH